MKRFGKVRTLKKQDGFANIDGEGVLLWWSYCNCKLKAPRISLIVLA